MQWSMFFENLRIAMKAIRTNLLRTILTILIIAAAAALVIGLGLN